MDRSWWSGPQVGVDALTDGGLAEVLGTASAKAASSAGPAGLADQHLQLAEFEQHLAERQPSRAGRQDRRLDHGMLRPVEAEEVAVASLGDGLRPRSWSGRPGRRARRPGTRNSGRRPTRIAPATMLAGRVAGNGSIGAPIAVWARSSTSSVT